MALIVGWALAEDVSLTPLAWTSRVLPMLLLGVLLGWASDRLLRAEAEQRRLEGAALLRREAIIQAQELAAELIRRAQMGDRAAHRPTGTDRSAPRALGPDARSRMPLCTSGVQRKGGTDDHWRRSR